MIHFALDTHKPPTTAFLPKSPTVHPVVTRLPSTNTASTLLPPPKLSPKRTITYHYYPQTNQLSQVHEYVTVSRSTPSSAPSTPALSNATTRTSTPSPPTPTIAMARQATGPRVGFATQVRACRPARDDELSVMRKFASHAAHCRQCEDPYRTWRTDGELCDRGHSYARDVAKYIYSKGGRPCSVVDKESRDERNEIEVPVDCEVIRNLTKAFDRGLSLKSKKAVVSHDPKYYISDRKESRYFDRDYGYGAVVTPSSSKPSRRERYYEDDKSRRNTIHFDTSKGSLYHQDEEAKRSRRRYDDEPVVIIADLRRRRYER